MDYEKKYKEALERARKINSREEVAAPEGWTICEVIFPELKESEDERIRKALICGMNALKDNQKKKTFAAIPIDDCIAWLEKQGNINDTTNRTKFTQAVLRGAAINLITWIDYNAAEGNMCLSNTECKDIIDSLANCNWDKIYDYMKKKLEKQVPNPKWTEEDEERLQSCINSLQGKGLMGGVDTINTKWLKSLKQRMEE